MNTLKSETKANYSVINPQPSHFEQIQELCKKVYPFSKPWSIEQLQSHRSYFPDGQLIVINNKSGKVVGMAFSLIIYWDDYLTQDSWKDFTSSGFFHNHDPRKGKTLYGAEVMVDPELRGLGIGKMLYEGRIKIAEKYNLKRIRAGARLRGYGKFSEQYSPVEYVKKVVEKKIYDPTLSFQLSQGFKAIDVAPNYLFNDPESLGFAAVIEWLNPKQATPKDYQKQKSGIESLLLGQKFISEHLPRELRRLVRKATFALGDVIKEYEGEDFFERIEFYRTQLKKARGFKKKNQLIFLLTQLQSENKKNRLKIAHSFALQLELVNVCEAAYRTWRQRLKPSSQISKSKLDLTFVLTAHPTEARESGAVDILSDLGNLMQDALQNNLIFNDHRLASLMRMLWLHPLSKENRPSVGDEAEYIYSLIFSENLFDFILTDKPSYEINLRTWVGGDKDGNPNVNKTVMLECFNRSRKYILTAVCKKLSLVISDLIKLEGFDKIQKTSHNEINKLIAGLKAIETISNGDGSKVKAWSMKYKKFLKNSETIIQKHSEILLINRLLIIFPAFVFPIELREDSELIKTANKDKSAAIYGMLSELRKISGALGIDSYARGLVISHCESAQDISEACQLVFIACQSKSLPVIPLFETKNALVTAKKIIKLWLSEKKNLDLVKGRWNNILEVMLGYSDSSKQIGALPSRYLISKTMTELERVIKSFNLKPHFFHGSGGSVARGGGSLKEQIAWWPNSAISNPKVTVQGEMIQRLFSSKEILNSQCNHFANEAMLRKNYSTKVDTNRTLDLFVEKVSQTYSELISNGPLLSELLNASPYQYLELLKIGSRPSKRPAKVVSTDTLRAIPWVMCWTQTRLLMPTWWGIGTAWRELSEENKKELISLYSISPFFSSFVKTLGFTLSKVDLEVWQMYFRTNIDQKLFENFESEFNEAVEFVLKISQEKELIWYRPWLQESIHLRSSNIHLLNLLQILSFETSDEALLRETIVGIACGMLTTG